jgi:hypothetical protein
MIVVVLVLMLFVVGCGGAFGYSIMKPFTVSVSDAKRNPRRTKNRLYLCDFFTLSLLVVIPLAAFARVFRDSIRRDIMPFQIVLCILIGVCIYVWWRVAIALSYVGVTNSVKRSVMLGIVIPIVLIGSALVVPGLIVGAIPVASTGGGAFAIWLFIFLLIVAAGVGGRKTTSWIVSDLATDPSVTEESAVQADSVEVSRSSSGTSSSHIS